MNCTRKGYRGFPVSRVSAFNHVYVANQNNTLCIHEVIPTFPAETASHRLLSGDSILPDAGSLLSEVLYSGKYGEGVEGPIA